MNDVLMCPVCRLSLPSIPLRIGGTNVDVCGSLCAWAWEHHAYSDDEWCGERDPNMHASTRWDTP